MLGRACTLPRVVRARCGLRRTHADAHAPAHVLMRLARCSVTRFRHRSTRAHEGAFEHFRAAIAASGQRSAKNRTLIRRTGRLRAICAADFALATLALAFLLFCVELLLRFASLCATAYFRQHDFSRFAPEGVVRLVVCTITSTGVGGTKNTGH